MSRWRIGALTVLACIAGTGSALADGEFPRIEAVVDSPTDPSVLLARGNIGMFLSRDSGATWRHVCRDVVGHSSTEKPPILIAADGALAVGMFTGLTVSRNGGCDFVPVEGALSGVIADIDLDRQNRMYAARSTGVSGGLFSSQLLRSTDHGNLWTQVGSDFDSDSILFDLAIAPSESRRLYLTAKKGDDWLLSSSSDAGESWGTAGLIATGPHLELTLAAVHSTRPEVVLAIVDNGRGGAIDEGLDQAVLLTTDGGGSWSEAFRTNAAIFAAEFSTNGDVLVGVGPDFEGTATDNKLHGLWRVSTDTGSSVQVQREQVLCLHRARAGALYLCTATFSSGFDVARSDDDGATLEPLLRMLDIAPPLECPATSSYDEVCRREWEDYYCSVHMPLDESSSCDFDAAAAGQPIGAGGTSSDAGTAGAAGGQSAFETPSSASGCAVRAGHAQSRSKVGSGPLILMALAFRRRQRRAIPSAA